MTSRQLKYLPHRIALPFAVMLVLNFMALTSTGRSAGYLEGCPIFPADNLWNTPVDDLPVDSGSNTYITTIGANRGLHPDFGSGIWAGGPIVREEARRGTSVPSFYFNGLVFLKRREEGRPFHLSILMVWFF